MAKRSKRAQQYPWEQIEGATGASDATSGGGAGAGNPEPETIERTGGRVLRGNVQQDKKRLFPERFGKAARVKSGRTSGARGKAQSARGGKTASRRGPSAKSRARKSARK